MATMKPFSRTYSPKSSKSQLRPPPLQSSGENRESTTKSPHSPLFSALISGLDLFDEKPSHPSKPTSTPTSFTGRVPLDTSRLQAAATATTAPTRNGMSGLPMQRPPLGPRGNSSGAPTGGVLGMAGMGMGGAGMQRTVSSMGAEGGMDTMNLRLGGLGMQPQKPRTQQFTFRYDDSDTLIAELQEFFPYIEVNSLPEGLREFQSEFRDPWAQTPAPRRSAYLLHLLHTLESSSPHIRYSAARKLTYLMQGNFGETNGEEEQLSWVIENARMFRGVDGVVAVLGGLRDAMARHDQIATLVDQQTSAQHRASFSQAPNAPANGQAPPPQPTEPTISPDLMEKLEDINTEIGVYLGILYVVVEVCRGDDGFGEEMMALDPPLPVYLLKITAGLREKNAKGFPVKKLLLLLWKSLLACLGGLREVRKAVGLQRHLSGLAPVKRDFTKITPNGVTAFRQDLSVKYPTYVPNTSETIKSEKLAEATQAIPLRSAYHTSVEEGLPPTFMPRPPKLPPGAPQGNGSLPQPGTPAPSPPPTPPMKPKKQQYQTDQTKPFVFPFSRSAGESSKGGRFVPRAIDEADQLYEKHMHVSLGLHQLYKTREEYIREESGLGFGLGDFDGGITGIERSKSVYEDEEGFGLGDGEIDDEAWTAWKVEDWKLEEAEEESLARGDEAAVKKIKAQRSSLERLYRVEVIYRSILPYTQSVVVVLLKLLLATVTNNPAAANPAQPPGSPAEEKTTIELPEEKPMTMEELDLARHREVTSKAVSAILLLLLKWFKASHIIKFQHLSTLLIDSNCLLLVLKMFGLQELLALVQAKSENENYNLFRYCHVNFSDSRNRHDGLSSSTKPATSISTVNGEEIEYLNEYSWRNFFYAINFVRIMHQLTKTRAARISLLVQYKSSQILKRMLRVPHPMLQLQILKVLKSQVPFCGRKWRQTNMKTITAIYLNCKPELRDEWLAVTDIESDVEDSTAAEATLRSLIRYYHKKHYSRILGNMVEAGASTHRRSDSLAAGGPADMASITASSIAAKGGESDVFPPNRTLLDSPSLDADYNPDTLMGSWVYEYEEVIESVLGADGAQEAVRDAVSGGGILNSPNQSPRRESFGFASPGGVGGGFGNAASNSNTQAWVRLNEIIRARVGGPDDETISDSESVVSIGELGDDARMRYDSDSEVEEDPVKERQRRKSTGNENTWEHISPELSRLPKSPGERPRRRSSSSNASPLRPVMPTGSHLNSDWLEQPFEDEEDEPGPMPIQEGTEDELARGHMPADEVEAFYQM